MKIALVSPGPIRSFADCYQSWVDKLILPLEMKVGKGNVKIFLDYFSVTEDFYKQQFDKNIFTTKMEVDRPGWKDILDNSPYIESSTQYVYTDQYILDLFDKINIENNTDINVYELKKYNINKKLKDQKFKSYYNFIQGICSNYNNKKLIDKIPDEYDIIIKLRCDAFLISEYPIDKILKINDNTMYLQKGPRWDNFYMGKRSTLVQLYQNLYKNLNVFINTFKKKLITPEIMLSCLIKNEKIFTQTYSYSYIDKKGKGCWKVSRHLTDTKYKIY